MPSLHALLLVAIVATHVCATDHDVHDPHPSDSATGSGPNPTCISADVVESGCFGLAFFSADLPSYHKSRIVKTLNQSPDQEIQYDSVAVLNNVQHANGNSMFLINFPDFGAMIQQDLRAQILQFHEQYPQFAQSVPMARIYFFTGFRTDAGSLGLVDGGLQLLRDLYGMDIGSRIQFVSVTPAIAECPSELGRIFNEIFPSVNMLPVLWEVSDLNIPHLIADIHAVAKERPSFYLQPGTIQWHSYVGSSSSSEEDDTIEMSIDQVRSVQHLSGYARQKVANLDGESGDKIIPVHRNLQVLYDICGPSESSPHFQERAVLRLTEADPTVRVDVLHALCSLDVDIAVIDFIMLACRNSLSQDLMSLANVSVAAVQQYLQRAFPQYERIQTALLQYTLVEPDRRQQCTQLMKETLFLACPDAYFANLISSEAGSSVPYASKLQIILAKFTLHRPERVRAEFVDVLLSIAQYFTLECQRDSVDSTIYMTPLPEPHQVQMLLRLIVQYSCAMPEYLNELSDRPAFSRQTSPWHRLMLVMDQYARRPHLLSPEFVNSLCADLVRIAEQTTVENENWAERTLLIDYRGDGFLFLLRDCIRNTPESIEPAAFQNLIATILVKAFPNFNHRFLAFKSDSHFRVDMLFLDLGPEHAINFFRIVCRSISRPLTEDEIAGLESRLLKSLQYIHDAYPHDTVSQCLKYLCLNVSRELQAINGRIIYPDDPIRFSLVYVEYFLWLSSNHRIADENLEDFRHLLVGCREVTRLHGPALLHIMRSLNTQSIPNIYPHLVRSGERGIALYRQLEQNLSETTLTAVRRSARKLLPPELWFDLYSSDIVSEVAPLGVGQYFAEIAEDMEPERASRFQLCIVLVLLRSKFPDIPLVYLEDLLDRAPCQAWPMQEMNYVELYYRVLDQYPEMDLLEKPLSRYFLDEGRPEFFSLLCTQAVRDVTCEAQRQRRWSFCTQILLQLIEKNPTKAANVFAQTTIDVESLASALRHLLQCISQQMLSGPVPHSDALGDQIVSVYQCLDTFTEPHPAWQQWLTYMLPVSVLFPMEKVTASDLAFDAIHGLHPEVMLDHRSWLRDILNRVPEVDFNRAQDTKSILGELLFTLNQWPDALGSDDPNSALHMVVQRTSSWSVVMTERYKARLQAELSPAVKAALDHAIVVTRTDAEAELPEPDRHALASVLYSAIRRHTTPNEDVLRSLLVICSLLRLEGPAPLSETSRLFMESSYRCQYLEIFLQLYDVSEAVRLPQRDLIAAISECFSSDPLWTLSLFRGVSMLYRLLCLPLDFTSVDARDLVETAISRSSPFCVCGYAQNECVLDVIQRHANATQDPSFLQWLQHIETLVREKIAADETRTCETTRYQREQARRSNQTVQWRAHSQRCSVPGEQRSVVVPVDVPVEEIPPNRADVLDDAQNAPDDMPGVPLEEIPPNRADVLDHAEYAPDDIPGPIEQLPLPRPSTSSQQTTSKPQVVTVVIVMCAVLGVGVVAVFVWWQRRSAVVTVLKQDD